MTTQPEDATNQGTPIHGDPCAFPCFGNIGPPMMTTLNLPGFTVGLPVWFFTNPVVPNAPDASQVSIVCQEHQTNPDPLHSSPIKSSPPPSSSSSESTTTSNQKPRKKKKQGGNPMAFASQAGVKQTPASSSEARARNLPRLVKLVVTILLRNLRKQDKNISPLASYVRETIVLIYAPTF